MLARDRSVAHLCHDRSTCRRPGGLLVAQRTSPLRLAVVVAFLAVVPITSGGSNRQQGAEAGARRCVSSLPIVLKTTAVEAGGDRLGSVWICSCTVHVLEPTGGMRAGCARL